jgi:KDO2-lipid IV(A) lauroyltransferase
MAKPRSKFLDGTVGALTLGFLSAIKRMDRKRTANFAGALMRKLGPLLPEHRVGRDNLRAAFPEKSGAEIEKILAGTWDNLGRIAVEFAHLDEFCIEGVGRQTPDVITYVPEATERYQRILASGKPMVGFAAHLANWELPGVAAKLLVSHSAVLYRRPNIRPISDISVKLRKPLMGELVPNVQFMGCASCANPTAIAFRSTSPIRSNRSATATVASTSSAPCRRSHR